MQHDDDPLASFAYQHSSSSSSSRQRPSKQQQHTKQVDALLSSQEPLDEQEQREVMRELSQQAMQQTRTFRATFGALALALAAFFAHAAVQQLSRPWEQRFTGELRPVTGAAAVVAALALQAAALAASGLGLLVKLPTPDCLAPAPQSRLLVAASLLAAGAGCCYWGGALCRSVAKYGHAVGAKWELLWLPLGPLGYAVVCWHVLGSQAATSRELEQLQKLAYSHKKV